MTIIKQFIRLSVLLLGASLNKLIRFFSGSKPSVRILVYHDVPPSNMELFRSHINILKNRFSFITPEQFHDYMEGRYIPDKNSLLITFDDGFESSYISARDVLNPMGISALFFICSGFIDSGEDKDWETYTSKYICDNNISPDNIEEWQRPMSWQHVKELHACGHSIGGHTRNHIRLSGVKDTKEICNEIVADKEKLEKELDCPIIDFAYPFGCVNSISSTALSLIAEHYKYCYSGVRGLNRPFDNTITIRRDVVGYYLSLPFVRYIADGGYDLFYTGDKNKLAEMVKSQPF